GEVLVADNGSTDGSISIAQQQGARVVDVPERGYGAALHHGICSASFDYVVFADADMSYPFIEISSLIQPLLEGRQFCVGKQIAGENGKRCDAAFKPASRHPRIVFLYPLALWTRIV
ncbi:MAG TPA: glycosyltransferase, partial [Oligoflexia bacterium]|nr:glycosyltransferase [Oligoflexia bacterium]